MTKRTRRETAKATELVAGQKFAPHGHGEYKATVTNVRPYHRDNRLTVVSYAYPDDFTVNSMTRGTRSAAVVPNDTEFTRYV